MATLLSDDEVFGPQGSSGLLSDDEVFGTGAASPTPPPTPKQNIGGRVVDAIRSTLGATAQEGIARGNSARQIALTQGTQPAPTAETNPIVKRLVDEKLNLSPNMDTLRTQGFAAASREALAGERDQQRRKLAQDTGTIGPVPQEQQIQMLSLIHI